MGVTVAILCYGDHEALARRCLGSVVASAAWDRIADLRVGLNAAAPATRDYVAGVAAACPVPVRVYTPQDDANVGKYPLMRVMLADPTAPTPAQVMWFDDDSFVRGTDPAWWGRALKAAEGHVLTGPLYAAALRGNQPEAIRAQPWYTNQPVFAGQRVVFAQGGWWIADAAFLRRWDYPFPELHHRGGDVMLGALCHQQGKIIRDFRDGVAANADELGRESKSTRRGLDEPPLWTTTDRPTPARPKVCINSYAPGQGLCVSIYVT